jgi:hypothetical protein
MLTKWIHVIEYLSFHANYLLANLNPEQLSRLERLESLLTIPPQFEDAIETEDHEMIEVNSTFNLF